MPHTLYATIGSGNCYKAHLVMNQLQIPYQTVFVDVLKGETREPDYLALNPKGTVPFLTLDTDQPISESNAMLWYLAKGSDLLPESAYVQSMIVEWMIFEQTKLEPNISPARFFTSIMPSRSEEMSDQIIGWQDKGQEALTILNDHLATSDFVAGDAYTIADIAVYGYTHVADEGGFNMADYPAVQQWIERVGRTRNYVPMSALPMAA